MPRFRLLGDFATRDAETALLWQAGCSAIEQDGAELVAYFPERLNLPLLGRWEEVPETDWLKRYYAELKPIVLSRLIVAPSHCEMVGRGLVVPEPKLVIRLDPGRAFGTGHHVTTRLALEALSRLTLSGKTVIDVGAGSGILAIVADLLGAAVAYGLDNDPETVPIARDNAQLNGSRAEFYLGALDETTPAASADVVVANLYAELHQQLALHYRRVLRLGGELILSGIMSERLPAVVAALEPLADTTVAQEDGWALVYARLL